MSKDAEIFSVILDGNLERLKHLPQTGEARLSTRDPEGRCLLSVRVFYSIPVERPNEISMLFGDPSPIYAITSSRRERMSTLLREITIVSVF